MINRSRGSPRDVGSDRHLSPFANDHAIDLRRIAAPQYSAEIVSILEPIANNKQRRQVAAFCGSLLLSLSKSLLQIFESSAREFAHPSQKALVFFRAT
jgi:hypothetical protein